MTPKFETDRLILKNITLADAPAYQKHFVDYEVVRHLTNLVPWPYPENGIVDYINLILSREGQGHWFWGIYLKSAPNEMIGGVNLWTNGKPENRGFWLGKMHWGHGYMTEAVAPVNAYAFNTLGFNKLVFANAVGNTASRRVKEKTGCKIIDVSPAKFVDPIYTEHEVWELSKSDWFKNN